MAGVDVEAEDGFSGRGEGEEGECEDIWEKHCRDAGVWDSSKCSNSCSTNEEDGVEPSRLGGREAM